MLTGQSTTRMSRISRLNLYGLVAMAMAGVLIVVS